MVKLLVCFCLFLSSIAFAQEDATAIRFVRGPSKSLGAGKAYSWIMIDRENHPFSIGATFSGGALENLPAGHEMTRYSFSIPMRGIARPFDHLEINWNPMGHIPIGVYNVPHFDFHFFFMSRGRVDRISCAGPDLARCEKPLASKFVPHEYILPPGTSMPAMGAHWIDPFSPEFHGQPFTASFIFGSYGGHLNFIEPMVTREFFLAHPDFSMPIKQPSAYERAGFYPTSYRISYSAPADSYTVALEDFHEAK
jgi:hypothetical protein